MPISAFAAGRKLAAFLSLLAVVAAFLPSIVPAQALVVGADLRPAPRTPATTA